VDTKKMLNASLIPSATAGVVWAIVSITFTLLRLIPIIGAFINCCVGIPLCIMGLVVAGGVGYYSANKFFIGKAKKIEDGAVVGAIAGTIFGIVSSIISGIATVVLAFLGIGIGSAIGVQQGNLAQAGITAGIGTVATIIGVLIGAGLSIVLGLIFGAIGGIIAAEMGKKGTGMPKNPATAKVA
jgi:hypothetical protein